jgi:hypothetical protein
MGNFGALCALTLGCACVAGGQSGFAPIRVNAGNSVAYTDPAGQVWAADYGYNSGTSALIASQARLTKRPCTRPSATPAASR